ncbi:PREDICTED: uncharacterized protein LOC109480625 isoform X2 [Branchiostoma belcheri]|uniref:Uncharacterized protein LOC109480625 isoform X2 n=1 Tax=Branchiostoma belcheri TaxID=7741 RepID=A0A6P4ZAL8_BRABE|nr:PREDICTED: uncharacterized protein LOC109480625 isoform X2 [Branchiostoma belcheri]
MRILCQILRLPERDIQAMEDLSCSGPPGLIVLENQEFPMLPDAGQLGQEQAIGAVHVFSPASEQLIVTEQGHPLQFLWEVAARTGLIREVCLSTSWIPASPSGTMCPDALQIPTTRLLCRVMQGLGPGLPSRLWPQQKAPDGPG